MTVGIVIGGHEQIGIPIRGLGRLEDQVELDSVNGERTTKKLGVIGLTLMLDVDRDYSLDRGVLPGESHFSCTSEEEILAFRLERQLEIVHREPFDCFW